MTHDPWSVKIWKSGGSKSNPKSATRNQRSKDQPFCFPSAWAIRLASIGLPSFIIAHLPSLHRKLQLPWVLKKFWRPELVSSIISLSDLFLYSVLLSKKFSELSLRPFAINKQDVERAHLLEHSGRRFVLLLAIIASTLTLRGSPPCLGMSSGLCSKEVCIHCAWARADASSASVHVSMYTHWHGTPVNLENGVYIHLDKAFEELKKV